MQQHWKHVQTIQWQQGIAHLERLWKQGKSGMLISNTGTGKTEIVKTFRSNKSVSAFVVTASKSHKLQHILNELLLQMDGNEYEVKKMTEKEKVDGIISYVRSLGKQSIIIIDEAENLDIAVLKTIKTFYDALVNVCAIALIGTPELLEKMLNKMSRHRGGIPQLYRRLKVGTKILTGLNKEHQFPQFFEKMGVSDVSLQKLLLKIADNYGELHDYLQPVIRQADETKQPLTEKLFRLYHDLPRHAA